MATAPQLRFDVTSRTQNGNTVYEAVARIPGFKPASVQKIENGCTVFSTRSSVTAACKNRASSLGMTPLIRYTAPTAAASVTVTTRKNRKPARAR